MFGVSRLHDSLCYIHLSMFVVSRLRLAGVIHVSMFVVSRLHDSLCYIHLSMFVVSTLQLTWLEQYPVCLYCFLFK